MDRYRLKRDEAALLVVDLQERLCAAMEPRALERVINRSKAAVIGAQALGLPVIVTEQYPKGLGRTLPQLAEALTDKTPVEKIDFSCALEPVLQRLGNRKQVLVVGMETHVCVFQTVRDLASKGFTPYLCADGVLSRTEEDKRIGLELCRETGSVITTVEASLFDLLGRAGSPEFKAVSAAVK